MAEAVPGRAAGHVVVASGNRHKVAELRAMLAEAGVAVSGMHEHGEPPTVEETAPDFEGNAVLKATEIAAWLRERGVDGRVGVLADDSGICVDALHGAPGVRSARFAGDDADDAANNERLVAELRARGVDRSPACYLCVLALCRVDGQPWPGCAEPVARFCGRWNVEVRTARRGRGGFGYDPHAWLDDGARTVAELGPADKAARSHRGQALRALLAALRTGC